MNNFINDAKAFLVEYLENHQIEYSVTHPFRADSKFVILHSLRVHNYALKIIEEEILTAEEKIIVEVSCLLHDLGRANITKEGHAKLSRVIVSDWLDKKVVNIDKERLLKIIENHSYKDIETDDICEIIVKDADILDEIGVLSIFMTSYRTDINSPFFFNYLLDNINKIELDYCFKQLKKIKTKVGKRLLESKVNFINQFISELELEIEGTNAYFNSKSLSK